MKRNTIFAVITALSVLGLPMLPSVSTAGHDRHSHSHGETAAGPNPLVSEMIILDRVFQQVVSAVALGNGAKVENALEAMHGTMEKTHEGVHEGTVRIPKNASREKEFVEMDKAFHANLERLADAGQKNDQARMLSLTKTLLEGCVNCHREFRK